MHSFGVIIFCFFKNGSWTHCNSYNFPCFLNLQSMKMFMYFPFYFQNQWTIYILVQTSANLQIIIRCLCSHFPSHMFVFVDNQIFISVQIKFVFHFVYVFSVEFSFDLCIHILSYSIIYNLQNMYCVKFYSCCASWEARQQMHNPYSCIF